jgi:hypothetical protein
LVKKNKKKNVTYTNKRGGVCVCGWLLHPGPREEMAGSLTGVKHTHTPSSDNCFFFFKVSSPHFDPPHQKLEKTTTQNRSCCYYVVAFESNNNNYPERRKKKIPRVVCRCIFEPPSSSRRWCTAAQYISCIMAESLD